MQRTMSCQACGTDFEAKRSDARFCHDCRHHRQRGQVRDWAEQARTPCPVCGRLMYRRSRTCQQCHNQVRPFVDNTCSRCGVSFQAKQRGVKYCSGCRNVVYVNYEARHPESCIDCGKAIVRRSIRCKGCENKRRAQKVQGSAHHSWKGGRTHQRGYVMVRKHPGSQVPGRYPYRLEHRLIWEEAHGPIPKGWHVHHLNGIKDDNRLENLLALSPKNHHSQHEAYRARIRQLEEELDNLRIADALPAIIADARRVSKYSGELKTTE